MFLTCAKLFYEGNIVVFILIEIKKKKIKVIFDVNVRNINGTFGTMPQNGGLLSFRELAD